MHLPRKWINSDLVSSQLLQLFFNFKTSNPNSKPYAIIDRKINHKAAFQTNQMMLLVFSFVFTIVAMAVGTKRLAFGITIFAFVFLVLEYVGRFSTCSSGLQLIVRSCFPLLATGMRFEHRDLNNLCEASDDGLSEYSTVSGEIGNCDDSIVVREQNEMDVKKMASGGEECIDAGGNESLRIEKRRSRRAILKAKIIRRLVPKKFRHSKYCKMTEGNFEDHFTTSVKPMEGDISVGSLTIRQVISEVESDCEESNYSNFSVRPDDCKNTDELNLSWHSDHSLKSESGSVIFRSSKPVATNTQFDARGGKSGYMMLMVVVLAGLMGGRILSFLLAIGYCCIFKYIITVNKSSAEPIFASTVRYTV